MDLQGVEVVRCHEMDQKLGHPRCWRSGRGARSSTCGALLCAKPLQFPRRRGLVEFEETELLSSVQAGQLGQLSTQERNARLQDLVRSFVLRASAGVPCQIVDAITGCSWPANYCIDSRLQQIIVEVNSQMHWTCKISDVQHVMVWQDEQSDEQRAKDQESFFPLTLRKLLSPGSLSRLVMLEQKDGSRLCLLEEEASHAEELRVAVSILRLYAREQGSAAQRPAVTAAASAKGGDALEESDMLPLRAIAPDLLL